VIECHLERGDQPFHGAVEQVAVLAVHPGRSGASEGRTALVQHQGPARGRCLVGGEVESLVVRGHDDDAGAEQLLAQCWRIGEHEPVLQLGGDQAPERRGVLGSFRAAGQHHAPGEVRTSPQDRHRGPEEQIRSLDGLELGAEQQPRVPRRRSSIQAGRSCSRPVAARGRRASATAGRTRRTSRSGPRPVPDAHDQVRVLEGQPLQLVDRDVARPDQLLLVVADDRRGGVQPHRERRRENPAQPLLVERGKGPAAVVGNSITESWCCSQTSRAASIKSRLCA
jgi:hypothetical protein